VNLAVGVNRHVLRRIDVSLVTPMCLHNQECQVGRKLISFGRSVFITGFVMFIVLLHKSFLFQIGWAHEKRLTQ
tara:strand:- start:961 stop:1182 length:222 start_codon:yes stop_codon:yes gene_type:complete